jgi:hypothetical protein
MRAGFALTAAMSSSNEFHGDEFFTARMGGSANMRASGTNWSTS